MTPPQGAFDGITKNYLANHIEKHTKKNLEMLMGFLFILGSPGHSWASRDHFFGIQNQTFFDEESKVEPKRSLMMSEMDFGAILEGF